jgi:hypothetical protein
MSYCIADDMNIIISDQVAKTSQKTQQENVEKLRQDKCLVFASKIQRLCYYCISFQPWIVRSYTEFISGPFCEVCYKR